MSFDGSEYFDVGTLNANTSEFDLSRIPMSPARFVRITAGATAIEIDAFEALR